MGKIVEYNQPCLKCTSSDARQVYEDGSSFCFSCKSYFGKNKTRVKIDQEAKVKVKSNLSFVKELNSVKIRGIPKEIVEYYDVKVSFLEDGEQDLHYYPYGENSYKVRRVQDKGFTWLNKPVKEVLFGQNKFSPNKRIYITEGEIDAMAVSYVNYKRWNTMYPSVSISTAASLKVLIEQREWLRKFKEIILVFDMDEPGKKATHEALKILGYDKCKVVKLSEKDPELVLRTHGWEKLYKELMDAETMTPAGILDSKKLWKQLLERSKKLSVPYPDCLSGVNDRIKGMRFNEIALFIAGTSTGKSTLFREIMIGLIENTDYKIGIVTLEEPPAELALKISGMMINKNHNFEPLDEEELERGYKQFFLPERVLVLDNNWAVDDTSIIEHLEYMCLNGVSFIFIDHITLLVADGFQETTGNEAQDKLMSSLLKLVTKYDVWIGIISHLRKTSVTGKSFEEGLMPSLDDIKGSGSVKQISFDVIAISRNALSDDIEESKITKIKILKSRTMGNTGPAGALHYDLESGRFSAYYEEFSNVDEDI